MSIAMEFGTYAALMEAPRESWAERRVHPEHDMGVIEREIRVAARGRPTGGVRLAVIACFCALALAGGATLVSPGASASAPQVWRT